MDLHRDETYIELTRRTQNATFLIYVKTDGMMERMPKALPVIDMSAPVCCAPVAAGPISDEDALAVAMRLKAIADPMRVKIMSYLFNGEETSGHLATVLGLSESTVSHHLGQLRNAGLVISDRRGMNVFHRVKSEALQALCVVLDPSCCT